MVDPNGLKVTKSITKDQSGAPLTNAQNQSRTWNDATFLEVTLADLPNFQTLAELTWKQHEGGPLSYAASLSFVYGRMQIYHPDCLGTALVHGSFLVQSAVRWCLLCCRIQLQTNTTSLSTRATFTPTQTALNIHT